MVNGKDAEALNAAKEEFTSNYQNQDLSLVMSKPGFMLMNTKTETVQSSRTKSDQERQTKREHAVRKSVVHLEETRMSDH